MGERMHLLADALKMMEKSFVLAKIQRALKVHRSEHNGYYYACESLPCSQIEHHLRCYVGAAQEELDAASKLAQARVAARNADRQAPDDVIEYQANLTVKASSPPDDSNHPVYRLESPHDPARIFNLKYPGLDFQRGRHRDALPAIAASYYLRFSKTGDPEVLLEFIREHPIEFECSGWVLSASGRILLGMPRPREGEERARTLFQDYWKQSKRPKSTLSLPQLFVLTIASQESRKLSTAPHRLHFRQAAIWLGKRSDSDTIFNAFDAFQKHQRKPCPCIDFRALKSAVNTVLGWSQDRNAIAKVMANILQEYIGIVCGIPSRTLRCWRSQMPAISF